MGLVLLAVGILGFGLAMVFTPNTGQGFALLSAPIVLLGMIITIPTGGILLYRKRKASKNSDS